MDAANVEKKIADLVAKEPRYNAAAYRFVADAVTFTVGRMAAHRHVSALELLAGVRDYARQEYGVLACEVLADWGLRSASDIGSVVYLLIDAELLAASPEDRPEDFDCDFALCAEPAPVTTATAVLPKID